MTRADPDRPICPPGCACTVGNEFNEASARRDLQTYRRKGPDPTTQLLIDGLRGGPGGDVTGLRVLDIGAGVGAVHLELLTAGAATAIDIDGSPAYVAAAKEEAERLGVADRVHYEGGDFVELAPAIEPVDLVALDRVVCCYPDMAALVGLSAARARWRYGLVFPRDTWWIRAGSATANVLFRLFRQRTRFWVHGTAAVEAIVSSAGLRRTFHRDRLFWQVSVFERA
jgi:magnesium-protoporphyrin O-methyltransferase